jgi:hypothetical protein
MKVHLKGFDSFKLARVLDSFMHTAVRAQLGLDNHRYDKKAQVLTMRDCTVEEYITSPFPVSEYSVWFEVPLDYAGPIPVNVHWGTTEYDNDLNETFTPFTFADAQVLRAGTVNQIVHFDQLSANISKHDAAAFFNDNFKILDRNEVMELINDEEGEYWVDEMV